MFRCSVGNHLSKRGEPMTKIVLETRTVDYGNGGVGFETVREVPQCLEHAARASVQELTQR